MPVTCPNAACRWLPVGLAILSSAGLMMAGTAHTQDPLFSEAEAYERFMGRWSRSLAPLLVRFAGVRDGDRVLDVGSGTGALSAAVASEAPAARLMEHPAVVLAEHGLEVRPGLEVRVVENTDKVAYLTLPAKAAQGELSMDQLDRVTGGSFDIGNIVGSVVKAVLPAVID